MEIEKINNLEECRNYVKQRLQDLRPVFARAAIGDFSQDVSAPEEDDEFTELYVGIQTMLEIVRYKINDLEQEVGQRQEVEQMLIAKNKELAQAHRAMVNVMNDLQESKSEVEQEEAKYEALLNSIGHGVIATDKDGIIIFINSVAENLLGWKSAEITDQKFMELVKLKDGKGNYVPDDKKPLAIALTSGHSIYSSDFYFVRRDKSSFPVAYTVSPVILGEKVLGGIMTFRDITEEKALDRAKSEFISVASHQLRTPVTALKWLSEISSPAVKKLNPKEKKYFQDLSSSVERLSKLVEDLLNVSRIELGTAKPENISIDLVKFVKDFVKDIDPYAKLKEHKLTVKTKLSEAAVNMDPKMLYNVAQNLISNAIDYSPSGTEVTVSISLEEGFFRVSVANNGPAIPEEEQKKLFQKFYRGESTKKMKTEGTGLGLYIVKAHIESAGGTVGFESGEGKETVFWFTLPKG